MKPGKDLCCMFLLAILGVDSAQNLAKHKRWLCVLIQLTKRSFAIMYLRVVYEHKTKYVQGQGPSNINLSLFVCLFV